MAINVDAVGTSTRVSEVSWSEKDCLLYALAVGAGAGDNHLSGQDLRFTTENTVGLQLAALPTLPAVLLVGDGDPFAALGSFDRAMLVHAEHSITLHQTVPTEGRARGDRRISGIYDKGSGALVVVDSHVVDAASEESLWTMRMSFFIRGEGGWGGPRAPSQTVQPPLGAPDHVVSYATRQDQSLLYRLTGDRNPLHSDPEHAKKAGYEGPILHGLCTYGFAGRALLEAICGSDPSRVKSFSGRFSRPVYPGETLTTEIWTVEHGEAVFRTSGTDGSVVLDRGQCTYDAL